jgi:hypothetical protein
MKLSCNNGYVLSDKSTGKYLGHLAATDASALMFGGGFAYDRRKSFKKVANREWADGVAWN